MEHIQILNEKHPSYGCKQAIFLFSICDEESTVKRLILVEAANEMAVQTIEIVTNKDGLVNEFCELISVYRNCDNVGIRSNFISVVEYTDFIIDIIDPKRLALDEEVSKAVILSLTCDDHDKIIKKLGLDIEEFNKNEYLEPDSDSVIECAQESEKFNPNESSNYNSVLSMLVNLGYKKNQAKKAVDALGSNIDQMTLSDAAKSALQGCSVL
ncbi:MAG TPA: hypothetical protein ENI61_06540 [Ignavibacteria bacterium]|nr:hypothetical protein [Ignavibacteria bacterium]